MALAQKGPLDGVKVVERVGRLAGSVCGARLADLGADVLRVLVSDDPLPNEPADWRAHPFAASHGRLIELDGKAADFARSWSDLAGGADIVIVTPPIGADGIADSRVLHSLDKDRQVICALSPFGLATTDPPLVDPCEAEMQAISGSLATTGDITGRPIVVDLPILELFCGTNAATAAVAALRVKELSGGGQLLDISLFDTCFTLTGTFLGKVLTGQARGFRNGCRHPLVSPWNAYETRDGWVILCTTNNQNWLDLTAIMKRPELADDSEYATAAARIGNVTKVDGIVADWAAKRSTAQALEQLQARGIPSGTVADTVSVAAAGPPVPCRRTPAKAAAAPSGEPVPVPGMTCEGIRVLEIGPYTAGPLAGRFLGNLGAEVIKIESKGGEDSRLWVPLVDGISCYFANYNADKKSVVLDLRSAPGKASFLELVRSADVLLFNLKAGALDRMGLGPDVLHAINPRLIYCAISGYGLNGAGRPALDTVIQAEAGVMSRIVSDLGPVKGGVSIADLAAAHLAPQEIIAALRQARRTGRGATLDISMYDTVAWMTGLCAPLGARVLPPCQMVQVADGWVLALGDKIEVSAPDTRTAKDLIAEQANAGIRAVKMLELDEVYDLSVAKREGLMAYEHAGGGGNCVISAPYAFDRTPLRTPATVPEVGADTLDLTGPGPETH